MASPALHANPPAPARPVARATTVLVVDDDADIREALVDVLEDHGFRAIGACDGVEALACFAEVNPDVAVIDLRMPRMNGTDFVRALRARGVHVPVVLMSATHDAEVWSEGLDVRAVVSKPFCLDDLVEHLARASARP